MRTEPLARGSAMPRPEAAGTTCARRGDRLIASGAVMSVAAAMLRDRGDHLVASGPKGVVRALARPCPGGRHMDSVASGISWAALALAEAITS